LVLRKIDTRNFRRATRSTSREINRQIVLNLVREHQPISRADLARRMSLGRGVVTSIVNELLADGAVYEGPTGEAPRGRKPTLLYVRTRDRLAIAVDVRFSRTYVMLADFSGAQIALETFDTITEPGELVAEFAHRIGRLLERHGAEGRCEGIGVVVPGMVDHRSGRILNAPQLGWRDVHIRDALADSTGLAVQIENAPLACALAKMWLGRRGEGTDNFVYLTVSDGVGTGIVVNGQVVRGHDFTAGEFGHVPLDRNGPRCLCGATGCLEAYTSNLATLSRYLGKELTAEGTRALLSATPLTVPELIARARTGSDAGATAALEETARHLGLGIAMIVNSLNPAQIFVGGEITAAWDLLEPIVRQAVTERALTAAAAETPVIPEEVGGYPRLRGATALVAAPVFAAPQVA